MSNVSMVDGHDDTVQGDLISRSDAKTRIASLTGMFTDELGFVVSMDAVLGMLDFTPAVDAVEVVRCKDCKHWDSRQKECRNGAIAIDNEGGASYSLNFWEDDFCSYGQRRDGE